MTTEQKLFNTEDFTAISHDDIMMYVRRGRALQAQETRQMLRALFGLDKDKSVETAPKGAVGAS